MHISLPYSKNGSCPPDHSFCTIFVNLLVLVVVMLKLTPLSHSTMKSLWEKGFSVLAPSLLAFTNNSTSSCSSAMVALGSRKLPSRGKRGTQVQEGGSHKQRFSPQELGLSPQLNTSLVRLTHFRLALHQSSRPHTQLLQLNPLWG